MQGGALDPPSDARGTQSWITAYAVFLAGAGIQKYDRFNNIILH
jgi:hypothetical protein